MRILVADDDRSTVAILERLLTKQGHTVYSCLHGVEVMDLVERLRPDALLLDLSMPQMDGYDVLAELRENPDLRPTLVAAVTAYGSDEERRKTAAAGCDLHIEKPIDARTLADLIHEWVIRP